MNYWEQKQKKREIREVEAQKKLELEITNAVDCFLKGETGKFGDYYVVENALVYRKISEQTKHCTAKVLQELVALRLKRKNKNIFIGNSTVLSLIGLTVCFGNETLNQDETAIQHILSTKIPMIPFNVFKETGLDLTKIDILDRGDAEKIVRDIPNPKFKEHKKEEMLKKGIPKIITETVHFTGASLFEIQKKYFLFDIDRVEIKHKIFNAFLVEIPKPQKTISDAYESLKPIEVKTAEIEGLEIKRQGEWFFIPVKNQACLMPDKTPDEDLQWLPEFRPMTLQLGNNSPNNAQYGIQTKHYVKGKIEHSGREHRTIILKTWHKAVPNTSNASFTIEGDVD